MQCFLNHYIPVSSDSKIIIKPIGQSFINGLSSSYDENYPIELKPYIEENIYKRFMNDINETLINYWPCFCARTFGYMCCLCTLGVSLLMPNICIKDAETTVKRQIDQINSTIFQEKGIKLFLVKKCSTSWLEIRILKNEKCSSSVLIEMENEMTE